VAPIVVLPAMDDPADAERLAEGYRLAIDVANRPELRQICQESPPTDAGADAARRLVVEQRYSLPHVVGTCAMGPDPADGAVVDASGAVHGTDGLFVVDASIIPAAPSGFPHLITLMLAERLADSLRHDG
jgi:choline dehydrogenase